MNRPKVAILMATFNGISYLEDQIACIARQQGATVVIFASDDGSSDGTANFLCDCCARHDVELHLLCSHDRLASSAKNFFRLIRDVEANGFDYFAFADQDDIWNLDKLIIGMRALKAGADGISSNVTAFWPDGRSKILLKSQPQRRYDHLFSSPGPGCTFLLNASLFRELQRLARAHPDAFERCELHDWAIYALARGLGYRWRILPDSTMRYRQHAANVFGARHGLSAWRMRIDKIREGWMYHQVLSTIELIETCCPTADLTAIKHTLQHPSLKNRMKLCLCAYKFRRGVLDRWMIGFLFITSLFWPKHFH